MRITWKPVCAMTLAGAAGLACNTPVPSTPPGPRAVRAVAARTAADRPGNSYAGSLEPRTVLDLAFGVPGRMRSLGTTREGSSTRPLREGDTVTRGQLLAALDGSDLERQVSSSQLATESAQAELRSAQATLTQAESDAARARGLASAGALSTAESDRIQMAAKTARARVEALTAQQGSRGEQLAMARRAASDARLLSPMDGIVARRLVDVGELVNPSTVVVTVIDARVLKLVIAVPDTRIGAVHLDDLVPVYVTALGAAPLVGRVTTILPVADPALRTFSVEISIDNSTAGLRAGTVASANLGAGSNEAALLVPLASVVRGPDGRLGIFSVDTANTAHLRPVQTGDLVGNDVVLKSGVAAGDRVVTAGAPFLHDGEMVTVLP